ncbi:hypothetical protein KBZ21_40530, partial [Streptomyces sp. A73]|nr:hypothetical protein [Streptomyces sp. A73]
KSVAGSVSRGLSKLKDAALGGVYKAASAAAKPIRSLINKVPGEGLGEVAVQVAALVRRRRSPSAWPQSGGERHREA